MMLSGPSSGKEQRPQLSLVVLQWDNVELTRSCVESLRAHTDVPHELIIVDNGSAPEAVVYARDVGDVAVCNGRNLGFAGGMNAGLRRARGDFVVFINNDTTFPPGWASLLVETATTHEAGMVVPAVTRAGNKRTVRATPGAEVEKLPPFLGIPAGVVALMPTDVCVALGGYGEDEYPVASAEDLDLAFKVWVNDRSIVFDPRVLVDHVGHATANVKLDDRPARWAANREVFYRKWLDLESDVPRLADVAGERHAWNRRVAAEAVALRKDKTDARQELRAARRRVKRLRQALKQCQDGAADVRPTRGTTRWRRAARRLPAPVRRWARAAAKSLRASS